MKDKYSHYNCDGEIFIIDCSLLNGSIEIYGVPQGKPTVEKIRHSHIKISEKDGVLKIKQPRKPWLHKSAVKIYVPDYCMPDVSLTLPQGRISVENGIYGDLRIKAGNAEVSLNSLCAANAEISGGAINVGCKDVSVKQLFTVNAESGSALIEKSLCTKLDLRFKDGDAGVTGLKFRDGSFSVERGSISLNLNGAKSDYLLNLLSKNGTCNCESTDTGEYVCKAYTEYGKIIADFTENESLPLDGETSKEPFARGA